MEFSLNSGQAKGLADFFFDLAKGLVLGGLGLTVTTPLQVKIVVVSSSVLFALWCVKMALFLLEEAK